MRVQTAEVRSRGRVTIPKAIRDANNIKDGQRCSFHDLGNGMLVLSPQVSQINAICDDLRDMLPERGETLEGMMAELRRIRETPDA